MESFCYSVAGIFDDSRSVSSLTTVLVSNRSKVTPETCSTAEVPHQEDEKDVDTIDSEPSHEVAGSYHPSIFSASNISASDGSEVLDPDLQAEMADLRDLQAKMEQAKEKIKKEQRKRNFERAKQAEHEDQKTPTKKRRDDEDDKDGI
jgi:hypothetical protein